MEHTPKIIMKSAPHLRRPQANVTRMMRDVVIALLPVTIFAVYSFGLTAIYILIASVLSMMGAEYLYYQIADLINGEKFAFKNKSFSLYNYSAFVSGLIYGLTLPDDTPIWIVVLCGALGIVIAKLIFGGLGQNVFNPAAVARAIVVFNYIAFTSYTQHVVEIDGVAGATALSLTNKDAFFDIFVLDHYSLLDLFTGIGIPGSLGEVSALLIILGGIYLWQRASFEVRIPIAYVTTVFVLASAVAIQQGLGIWYPVYHIVSGGLLFGAIFMATDPITSPITKPARIYYGFALGFITFVIRLFGGLPEGVVFSILIMNMFVPTFDYFKWTKPMFTKKANIIFAIVVVVSIVITLVGATYVG